MSLIRVLCSPAPLKLDNKARPPEGKHVSPPSLFVCLFLYFLLLRPNCTVKIGAVTHISNNLAVRLNIGALQRKRRLHGLGAFSGAHQSTSSSLTCFYGNSHDWRGDGIILKQRNPSLAVAGKSRLMVFIDR